MTLAELLVRLDSYGGRQPGRRRPAARQRRRNAVNNRGRLRTVTTGHDEAGPASPQGRRRARPGSPYGGAKCNFGQLPSSAVLMKSTVILYATSAARESRKPAGGSRGPCRHLDRGAAAGCQSSRLPGHGRMVVAACPHPPPRRSAIATQRRGGVPDRGSASVRADEARGAVRIAGSILGPVRILTQWTSAVVGRVVHDRIRRRSPPFDPTLERRE